MATPFTPAKSETTQEILKCGKDPEWFIRNYIKIEHPQLGVLPFKLYPFQKDTLKNFFSFRFNIVLKARQLGVSTLMAAYIVWLIMFHRDKNVLVVATKFNVAAKLVRKVRKMISRLPTWLAISKVMVDNRASIELDNGSIVNASTTAGDAGRAEALSLLVIDEAAHIDGLDDLWAALFPTLSTGGSCIAASTPNGVGNWFHKIYSGADAKKNDFKPIFLPWNVHPDRDQAWFEKETRNMTRREIAQELDADFLMSGETVFDGKDIARIEKGAREPIRREGFDRNLWFWKEPVYGGKYVLCADVARGDGSDYSAFHVINLDSMEVVAEYQGKCTVDMFSPLIYNVGLEYGGCLVIVENNGIGFAVCSKLEEMKYPNLFYSHKSDGEFVDQYDAEQMSGVVAGFTMSPKMRPIVVAKFEEYLRNGGFKTSSARLAAELRTFIWHNGKPEALSGYNDDLILSAAIGCWVRETVLINITREMEYKRAFLSSITTNKKSLNTRLEGPGAPKRVITEDAAREMEIFSWVYKG